MKNTIWIKSIAAAISMALCTLATAHTEKPASDHGPWLMRSPVTSYEQLKLLRQRGAEYDANEDRSSVLVRIDSQEDYDQLSKAGFQFQLDTEATLRFNTPVQRSPSQITGISGFPCYRTVDETYARAVELTTLAPNLVEWIDIGDSALKVAGQGGDDVRVLRITNRSITGTKPVLFALSAIHAREYATAESVLRFGERLVTQYGIDPDVTWIVDHHDINLVVVGNPDGRRLAEVAATQNKRKNHNPNFACAASPVLGQGVDLNRNYPFDWGGAGSSTSVCSDIFRGTARGSEPETQAIIAREQAVFPDQRNETPIPAIDLTTPVSIDATGVYIDVHSNGNGNWYSWGNVVSNAPNASQLRTLARKLGFYNGFPTDQSAATGAIGGATDDFTFATLGVTSYTMELNGSSFFPACATYDASIAPGTVNSLLFAAKVVRAPLKLPSGPEISGVAQSFAATGLTITANASDVRVNSTAQVGGQPAEVPSIVVAVDIYNTLPWLAGATPIGSFTAQDGSFNSTAEQVTITIPNNQLPAQKTLWYLQARDAGAAGFQAGPITAVFVSGDAVFQNGFE